MADKTNAELFNEELTALFVKYPTVKLNVTHNVQVFEEVPAAAVAAATPMPQETIQAKDLAVDEEAKVD